MIIPGSGNEMVFNDPWMFNCTNDSCAYTFSSDGITNSYSVAVEVVGCVTNRIECTNSSKYNPVRVENIIKRLDPKYYSNIGLSPEA